ncbi:hypothetical protein [Candidatus Bathycorpusculum sp.]|uniref:hypothetical protein n=1 Tax=Candidatus Bathycorpusculum sp. TaxID=2994959 RepID=UPI0028266E53|nr:hypothetical protein [Candidatus Termitimicrobium sp.]
MQTKPTSRPRISRKEAEYITKQLKLQLEIFELYIQKYRRLKEEQERHQKTSSYLHKEKQIKISNYDQAIALITKNTNLHNGLIIKFQAIADGTNDRHTMKHLNNGRDIMLDDVPDLSDMLKASVTNL